ncbi:MAG: FAD-dependent oxidoreductase [Candidatus Promineifilaceae bacterium]|nr:FAD-dependent oxidoreductase [Candidatus Promineifilaceae bacterium]
MYDLIIVGGGPAGLTAAIYAIRKRLDVFMISQDLGGKSNYRMELPDVETHQVIRGTEMVDKFWRELDYLDFARRLEPVTRITRQDEGFVVITTEGEELTSRAVIVATGARVRYLDVPGERDYIGSGLSYSAMSYAPLFLNRRALVVGDGDRALKAVTELASVADTVHLVAHTPRALATPLVKRLATELKVVVWEGYEVRAIQGDEYVRRVVLATAEGVEAQVDVDGVFVELGLLPNSEPVQGLVDLDDKGRIVIDKRNRTSCPGVFAAGDVTDAFAEQVLIAIGEGAKAALSAYDYLLPSLE